MALETPFVLCNRNVIRGPSGDHAATNALVFVLRGRILSGQPSYILVTKSASRPPFPQPPTTTILLSVSVRLENVGSQTGAPPASLLGTGLGCGKAQRRQRGVVLGFKPSFYILMQSSRRGCARVAVSICSCFVSFLRHSTASILYLFELLQSFCVN